MTLATQRLLLVEADPANLRAALTDSTALATALAAIVPPSWPPEHIDADSLGWTLRMRESLPDSAGWWMYFILRVDGEGEPRLIGTVGYKGPPTEDRAVEIGYSIVADEQRRGYASEAAKAVIARAFADPRVDRVTAETLVDGVASQGVLRRCGFPERTTTPEPGILRFTLERAAWLASQQK